MKNPMSWVTWVVVIILLGTLVMQFFNGLLGVREVSMDQIMSVLKSDEKLSDVVLNDGDQVIRITTEAGQRIQSSWVGRQVDGFVEILQQRATAGTLDRWTTQHPTANLFTSLLYTGLPFLLLVIGFFVVMRMVNGGGSGSPLSFGKSKAKLASKDMPKTTFADVAGVDEAVEELQEIKEFLAEPAKFQKLGAKIPKGVLLYGPPGTGKTLLARAVAGEAGVPFFSISGSDFVEMFVGVGASRVRDLFEQAKEAAPARVVIKAVCLDPRIKRLKLARHAHALR